MVSESKEFQRVERNKTKVTFLIYEVVIKDDDKEERKLVHKDFDLTKATEKFGELFKNNKYSNVQYRLIKQEASFTVLFNNTLAIERKN